MATVNRFSPEGVIGVMDCFYTGWMTDRECGFSDAAVATLERLTPFLGLAIKAASIARIAETLVETYLGRDAGRRVLQGHIVRGVADRINTVLWFSDLRNYTRISATAAPEGLVAWRLCETRLDVGAVSIMPPEQISLSRVWSSG